MVSSDATPPGTPAAHQARPYRIWSASAGRSAAIWVRPSATNAGSPMGSATVRPVPLPTNRDGSLPTSGRYALADVVGLLRARGAVAARAGEKRGDALVPMAHSVGGGEIPGFSRGNGNFADFSRERPFWLRKQRAISSPCRPIPVAGLNGNWRRPNRELNTPNRELNRRMPPATAERQKS